MKRLAPGVSVVLAVLAVTALQAQIAVTPTLQVQTTDLAVIGPTVTIGNNGYVTASFSVKNTGTKPTPGTTVRVACQPVWVDNINDTYCSPDSWYTGSPAVPPLVAGDSYQYDVPIARIWNANPLNGRYRFNFIAEVDAGNAIAESNETNNKSVYVFENFQTTPPTTASSLAVNDTPPAPQPQPQINLGNINVSGGGTMPTYPGGHLQIVSDTQPWNPVKPTWIVVKNVGDIDTPNLTLQHTCTHYYYTGSFMSPSLNTETCPGSTFPWTVLVPPLKKGEFKALAQFLGPMEGSGWYYNPNPTVPAAFRAVFHIVPPHGDAILMPDLILATYKP
jgi:hypothetical protein